MNHLKKQSIHHKFGFTLVELLTTCVVLVIAAVIVIPYASVGASSSGQSAARYAVSSILTAQMDAIATQGYRRIHFYTDGSGWCVEIIEQSDLANPFNAGTAIFAEDATESQGQSQQSIMKFDSDSRFGDVSIDQALFDGVSENITFDPTGGIVASDGSPSTGGSFVIQSGEYAWQVQLAPLTGKIEVAEMVGAGP